METMFGVGLMIGPFLGSVLYEVDGFYLPFVVCGAALALCPLLAFFCITGTSGVNVINRFFFVIDAPAY
jgi:MFS family permease